MKIGAIKILISGCTEGVYLRWWYNGWHYYNFINQYEMLMQSQNADIQTTRFFSIISKVERPTKITADYAYRIELEGIPTYNITGFAGILIAEQVQQYESGTWRDVEITRGEHHLRDGRETAYVLSFEIRRKDIPERSTVYHRTLLLYVNDTLCNVDEDEVVAINRQTNDIAEMQDRQSDFSQQFRIKKTRAMRSLFELTGEVGATTTFPYVRQNVRLIQNGIEMITGGNLVIDRTDDSYYYVSVLSGNKIFFDEIKNLKLNDLTLASTNHTWNVATFVGTHAADLDYVYPLCEPSEDGSIAPLTDTGDRVDMYAGWIWPFISVRAIWDEIFDNAGFIDEGDILENDIFNKLFIPISSRTVTKQYADRYLYSMYWIGSRVANDGDILGETNFTGVHLVNGTEPFRNGYYIAPFTGTYKIQVTVNMGILTAPPTLTVYLNFVLNGTMEIVSYDIFKRTYEYQLDMTAGQFIDVNTTVFNYIGWYLRVIEITDPLIAYSSTIEPRYHLPALTQIDLIKMICNMFGLIPETVPRDRKVRFWNFSELYDNIAFARDWSAYLSERDDEVEFKFGDYAQDNYMNYRESDDVVIDTGRGSMQVDDETLPEESDVIDMPVSTCDEVEILDNIFAVNVSRIGFNVWNIDDAVYDANKTIDPRIVYVDHIREIASPPYEKTFGVSATPGGATTDIDSPKKASSIEVSFSNLVYNYASLSRMLTKTTLRRCKFNLPAYEVAGFKSYIPIYLSQYKAYFYVNKISNYVPGKLCSIDLIKL